MTSKRTVSLTFVICLLGATRLAMAQNSSNEFRPFNGFFADLFDDGSQTRQPQRPAQGNSDYNAMGTPQPHRVPTRAPQPQPAPQLDPPPAFTPTIRGSDTNTPAVPSRPAAANTRSPSSATGNNYSFQYDDGTAPTGPALNSPSASNATVGEATSSTVHATSAGMPLHERLKVFRQSPFGDTVQAAPSTEDAPLGPPPAEPARSQAAETATAAQRAPTPAMPAAEVPPSSPAPAEPTAT